MGEEGPSAFRDFVAGSQVAGYQLVEQIGRGGMAVVYRARDIRLDRWVALKILAPDLALDEVFRQRFIRESRAAAAVDHQNIIPIFGAGEADGVLFIAMRYVSGQDVRSLLDRVGTLPADRVVGIVTQVAAALDAAHAHGLVHRDVKPANMLLSNTEASAADHVYLSDFGVSKQSQSSSRLTRTGQLVGTLDYLAPEQVEGRSVDGRTDLYALACAAFEMLCGAPPFKREQSMAVLWAQLSSPPPALTSRCPGLPPAVDQVMAKALAKSPGDRYETCLDFASALRSACGLAADNGPGAAAGPPAGEPPRSATDVRDPTEVSLPRAAPEAPHAAPEAPRAPSPLIGDVQGPGPHGQGQRSPDRRDLGHHGQGQRDPEPFDPGWRPAAPRPASPYPPAPRPASPYPASPRPASPDPPAPRPTKVSPEPPDAYLPPKRRSRAPLAAGIVIVVLLLAGGAFALLRNGSLLHSTSSSGPSRGGSTSSSAVAVATAGPAATVRMYISAINNRDYADAWRLGGKNSGSTYRGFVHGFRTTERDTLTIVSVSGNVVTARVAALQTNGTVQNYQGNYTVDHGVITNFDIQQVS